jgi:glycerol-1-phosphate dehydrogenase [NAD(P)+]
MTRVILDLDALRGELAGSPGAARLRSLDLGRVIEGDSALDQLARAVAEFPRSGAGVVVLAAATPITVAGRDLRAEATEVIGRGFGVDWVTLGPPDGQVHADEQTVAAARQAASGAGCVVTIGSGTITDIGKFAAASAMPLVAVQTATSVNGYADPFSVLLRRGVKRTTESRWPDTLLIDPAILAAAPAELNRAGVGDLASMFTSTADWYLAGAIGADPSYDQAVADLSRRHGARLLALAADLDDDASLAELARILTLSGIAMGAAGSTAPSSGMEHAISHLLEMADTARGRPGSFHGTQVGIASIVAAAAWAHVRRKIAAGALDRPARLPDVDQARENISAAFKGIDPGGAMAAECFADYARKLAVLAAGTDPLAGLRKGWESHDGAVGEVLTGPAELASALSAAGLPVRFGALPDPVDDDEARWAVANCALLRRRFSVADLAMLLGCWTDDDVDQILAAAGVLGERA